MASGPAIITEKTGVPQGAPKSLLDIALGTLTLGRRYDVLAGMDCNSKSVLDDNYTIGESKNVKAVITNQRKEGSSIGMILNIKKEMVKLGVTGSYEKAIALKQSYVGKYEIDPTNIYIYPSDCPTEADRCGAINMGIPIESQ